MFPSFNILGRDIPMYGVMTVIGMLVAGFVFCYRIKKSGHDENDAVLFLLVLFGGMMVGGSVMHAIVNIRLLAKVGAYPLFKVLMVMFGGFVFYGGMFGATAGGLLFVKKMKLPLDVYMDNSALFAPLFHGFARIGCFLGGCCFGIESPFGFAAHGNTVTAIGTVSRFPVQLLESLCNFLIALAIYILIRMGIAKGRLFFVYLSAYSVVRFFDEFLRGDAVRGFVGVLSTSQFISIFVLAVGLVAFFAYPKIKRAINEAATAKNAVSAVTGAIESENDTQYTE